MQKELITKITKEEARLAAKLYIASMLALTDDFNAEDGSTDEVAKKVDIELKIIASKFIQNLELENLPVNTLDCMVKAKEIIQKKKLLCQ